MGGLSLAITLAFAATVLAQESAQRVDLTEFQKLNAAKKVLVVDVRDEDSYAAAHIPGAINIPLGDEEQAKHFKLLKAEKRPIVTYCA